LIGGKEWNGFMLMRTTKTMFEMKVKLLREGWGHEERSMENESVRTISNIASCSG
jgi:hypothetical protein